MKEEFLEIRLDTILESIEHGTSIKDKTEGLENLRKCFDRPQRSSNLEDLSDKPLHRICEILFKITLGEKATLLSTRKSASKTTGAATLRRLATCGDILRLVLKAGLLKLKPRTIEAIIEHVTQTLPTANGDLFEPLLQNYLRSLRVLFERPANVEHLKKEVWLDTVDFCLRAINHYHHYIHGDTSGTVHSPLSLRVSNRTRSRAQSVSSDAPEDAQRNNLSRQNLEEVFHIVLHLVSSPNAPLLGKHLEIANSVMHFLQLQGSVVTHAHHLALSIINHVLRATRTDLISFTQSLAINAIPILTRFWPGKSVSKDELLNRLRDEMLILLFLVHPHIEHAIRDDPLNYICTSLEDLVDVVRVDCVKRSDRDSILSLDDLEMLSPGMSLSMAFRLNIFQLRGHQFRAERDWAILQLIGVLERLISLGHRSRHAAFPESDSPIDIHPSKRRRMLQTSDRLLESLRAADERLLLLGLQSLPFVIQDFQLSSSELMLILRQLEVYVGDERWLINSWAVLAVSSCTFQHALSEIDTSYFVPIWKTLTRNLTLSATCRASALTLHALLARDVMTYRDIREDVDLIVSTPETNGPALLCDSSILLMAHLLHVRFTEAPGASLLASKQIIQWVLVRWNPVERDFATRQAVHLQPQVIMILLRTALGLQHLPLSTMISPSGPVAQAWLLHLNTIELVGYLLLLDRSNEDSLSWGCPVCPKVPHHGSISLTPSSSHFQAVQRVVLESIHVKASKVLQDWKSYLASRTSPVSPDMFRSTLHFNIAMLFVLSYLENLDSETLKHLNGTMAHLSDELIYCYSEHEARDLDTMQMLRAILLQAVQPILPSGSLVDIRELSQHCPCLLSFLTKIVDHSTRVGARSVGTSLADDINSMDLDDEFSVRRGQPNIEVSRACMPRSILALDHCYSAFYCVTVGKLQLIVSIALTPDTVGFVPSSFIDYLVALDNEGFLMSRRLIKELLVSDLALDEADAARLIERSGEMLESLELDRCEVALAVCVDILTDSQDLWSLSNDNEVVEVASQVYSWLINKALGKGITSPEVEENISRLLLKLLRTNPEYGASESMPSPRSSLFGILKDSVARVKFHIAKRIPEIFELFSLKDHDAIFVDILGTLPSDQDWVEGISLRLFVLAGLGSAWPTLLRRSIYHIFETPGRVPGCLQHATKCLKDMSLKLKVTNARELFDLFSPQLLYTWLDFGHIKDIPYQIFGFSSLRNLVDSAKDEATALMIMRGQEDSVKQVASLLEIDEVQLLRDSFARVMAYCIAHDISTPPANGTTKHTTGESRVKQCLGQDLFNECIHHNFADIVASFFTILDQNSSIAKYFLKSPSLASAAKILNSMKALSSSDRELPPNQQPTFRAKYLYLEIEHLCRKTEHEPPHLFTPTLVTLIVRKLLNSIHPALGSLHACAVLRKIRIIVSLAGCTATQGYPVQLLLQSIRPYVRDPECADDAIGIIRYLLNEGKVHLLQAPSFMAGFMLSLYGSLTKFMESSKASTTQESQHKKTLNVAQNFHSWFGQYLQSYKSPALKNSQSRDNFRKLAESAFEACVSGNAECHSAESQLLLQLLKDEETEELLHCPARELALSMLTSTFRSPTSYRDDRFGTDELSIEYAPIVWKTCHGCRNTDYRRWAARVLGRAFAASGNVLGERYNLPHTRTLTPLSIDDNSTAAVLSLLQELTFEQESGFVGMAERAIRHILIHADEPLMIACHKTLAESLIVACTWAPYQTPPSDSPILSTNDITFQQLQSQNAVMEKHWVRDFSCLVAKSVPNHPVLSALLPILLRVPKFAERSFSFILHLVLSTSNVRQQLSRKDLSIALMRWISDPITVPKDTLKLIINCIIYLRTQPITAERTPAERAQWLDIDYAKASKAATICGMNQTALLFFEEHHVRPVKSSRRSTTLKSLQDQQEYSQESLLEIYENIDDPDLYYGVRRHSSLDTIMARFEHEKDGLKCLSFRGAHYDNHLRRNDPDSFKDVQVLVKTLDLLNLNGLSNSLLQAQQATSIDTPALESLFNTARKLERWDIPVPSPYHSDIVALYKVFQAVQTAVDRGMIVQAINEGFDHTMGALIGKELSTGALHGSLSTLAALVELDEVFSARGSEQFEEILSRFQKRSKWMRVGRYDDISQVLSCRGTTLSTLSQHIRLQDIIRINTVDCRLVEVQTALLAAEINRSHNVLQESLSLATSMMDFIKPCQEIGINMEVPIHIETANALWQQGEISSSIGMLQALDDQVLLKRQTLQIGRSQLLSKIGHQVSVARLEKADKIMDKYLKPAISELNEGTTGRDAGQVLHQFAIFCDQQLQDADSLEDLKRLRRLSQNRADEVKSYDRLINKATSNTEKQRLKSYQSKAKTWLKLDEEELQRHQTNRDTFLRQCLENYLRALAASDEHDSNALRFSALWLEHSEQELANHAVSDQLDNVPSSKFAPLMNQLTSRLQDNDSEFQSLLFSLILRICTDHPYHGMYQIYNGHRTSASSKDESALSRKSAAGKVAQKLAAGSGTKTIWSAIVQTSNSYCKLAGEKDEQKYRAGRRIQIKDSPLAYALHHMLNKQKIPPTTMKILLAPDRDYSSIPTLLGLSSEMTIASGVSAPKVIVARADNGHKFKQLVKGGNDDLRQDAIMEQVFEQVSELLKTHRSTQQRNLSIRTYRVLPLTNTAGIIEFVPNTVPLHEYLMPAHERYHPKDLKGAACRKEIGDVQTQSVEIRIKRFRNVTERFHPVMRHFFTEKFMDPDEWFMRRLAYTRSTAAISILGHILGLGDRHGHNILLDTRSGEAVHIDLGVAFEMGRILPVPELVPFRLTRDIVDGMGITKTEGVFRRCCEFTLEALREEVYSIMSILDVLRYDPLYSWSISPVRLAKLQEGQSAAVDAVEDEAGGPAPRTKDLLNEPGEADRALTVVNKKLSKTLSVTATVNDLINQATDERNLAVLYSGWAAYA